MAVELVIFDCDGVLVDSEPLAAAVLAGALSGLGLEISVAEVDRLFRGRSLADIVLDLESTLGSPIPEGFLSKLNAETKRAFAENLAPIDSVRDALAAIAHRGIDMCVASSGSPEKIRHSLTLTGLAEFFEDRIFSAAQVARGQPAPDLFLFAAEQMGHPIKECVVIEDSIPGVTAALAAGASVYGFVPPSLLEKRAHGQALEALGAHVFYSMQELPGLLSLG